MVDSRAHKGSHVHKDKADHSNVQIAVRVRKTRAAIDLVQMLLQTTDRALMPPVTTGHGQALRAQRKHHALTAMSSSR